MTAFKRELNASPPQRLGRVGKTLASIVLGLAAAWSYCGHFVPNEVSLPERALLLVYLAALFGAGAYRALPGVVSRLLALSPKSRLLLAGGAALGGVLIALVAPSAQRPIDTLEIVAAGQHNPQSKASQVWLLGVYDSGGAQVPMADLSPEAPWQQQGTALLADAPATLRWSGRLPGPGRIDFVSHEWSGIVEVRWNGGAETIDLYAPQHGQRAVTLPAQLTPVSPLLFLADAVWLFGFVVAGFLMLFSPPRIVRRPLGNTSRIAVPMIAVLGAFGLVALIVRMFGPARHLRLVEYLAFGGYALLVALVLVCLCMPDRRLLALLPRSFPRPLMWMHQRVFGQTLGAWLLVGLGCAVVSAVLVSRLHIAGERSRAIWMKLEIDSPSDKVPIIALRYSVAPDAVVPFQWQPYSESILGLRPTDGQPLRIAAIQTDAGSLPLAQLTAVAGTFDTSSRIVPIGGALLRWPSPSRTVTLTLDAGSGAAEVLWYNVTTRVPATKQPSTVSLRLPATFQGWVLIPAVAVNTLQLELAPSEAIYTIRNVALMSGTRQQWGGDRELLPDPNACQATLTEGGLRVLAQNTLCSLTLPHVQPFNAAQLKLAQVVAWVGIVVVLLVILVILSLVAVWVRRMVPRSRRAHGMAGWAPSPTSGRRLAWMMVLIFAVAAAGQLVYALSIPISYIGDTIEYYDYAIRFAATLRFVGIESTRLPGYPVFLALLRALFGNSAVWIVVVQHLLFAMLAPITIWALSKRLPLFFAVVGGLAVGLAPAIAANAQMLTVESLFITLTTTALLVYVRYGVRLRPLIVVGALIGAATLVRLNGLLVLLVLFASLLLWGWCNTNRYFRQRLALAGSTALLGGYLLVAAPWHLHLALVRGTLDLAQGFGGFTTWAAVVYQRLATSDLAVVQPDHAIWALEDQWLYDQFFLNARYPHWNQITGPYNQRHFYNEGIAEGMERNARRLWQARWFTFQYGLTLTGNDNFAYYNDLRWYLRYWQEPDPTIIDPYGSGNTEELVKQMGAAWRPSLSRTRSWALATSYFVLEHWVWVAIPALVSIVLLALCKAVHTLLPLWVYFVVTMLFFATVGIPSERYTTIIEPVLYLLVIVGCYALTTLLTRRRSDSAIPAIRPSHTVDHTPSLPLPQSKVEH